MVLFPSFSRRRREQSQATPDVYLYDQLPERLRVQIVHIWSDAFGRWGSSVHGPNQVYEEIVKQSRKELGRFQLCVNPHPGNFESELVHWFMTEKNIDSLLDVIEYSFSIGLRFVDSYWHSYYPKPALRKNQAIDELNARFLESSVGYQFVDDQLIQLDSTFIHKEAVLPAIGFLHEKGFDAARGEFLEAHRYYRIGDYESCLTECCKSFESVIKVIAHKRRWSVDSNSNASRLISAIFDYELIPKYIQSEFSALKSILESGVPTVRNKDGGHGSGVSVREVPKHIAAFQLHQTAAAIQLLVSAHLCAN